MGSFTFVTDPWRSGQDDSWSQSSYNIKSYVSPPRLPLLYSSLCRELLHKSLTANPLEQSEAFPYPFLSAMSARHMPSPCKHIWYLSITFNSLLGVCSRGGLWEVARSLFDEMANRKIKQDVFSYNTLLDAICKGGQMDLSFDILAQMHVNRITPNVVSYSTVIDGFAKTGRYEEALCLFDEWGISVLRWIEFLTTHCFPYTPNLVEMKKRCMFFERWRQLGSRRTLWLTNKCKK